MGWYDTIEKEIRPIVRLLRDNGYNTTGSCGHDRYVELDIYDFKQVELLWRLLYDKGYRDFIVEASITIPQDGFNLWKCIVKVTWPTGRRS